MAGGFGAEREISLISGAAVGCALRSLGHQVDEVDPAIKGWQLPEDVEVVFLALHGEFGEDGQVQALLESLNVPYTGTGSRGSVVAFDKVLSKEAFSRDSIPTPKGVVLTNVCVPPSDVPPPWVLKPVAQGSSVGLIMVDDETQWASALEDALIHGKRVLCEERVEGREITVGVLAGKALPVVEVRPKSGAYDYQSKYTKGATEYSCPADLPDAITEQVQLLGVQAFKAVGALDFGRVDIMLDSSLSPYVLEVNTLPGMTETSLFPKAAAAADIGFNQLCQCMVNLAINRDGYVG
jgi:D-alanine-D-alanine ligase